MSVNPLVFTERKNNLIIDNTWSQAKKDFFAQELSRAFSSSLTLDKGIGTDSEFNFNEILKNTTIKRACCMAKPGNTGNYSINVKIPYYSAYYDTRSRIGNDQTMQDYGFINYEVQVKKEYCNNPLYGTGTDFREGDFRDSDSCKKFYAVYCLNKLNDFIIKEGKTIDSLNNTSDKFNFQKYQQISDECGCYSYSLPSDGGQNLDSIVPRNFRMCNDQDVASGNKNSSGTLYPHPNILLSDHEKKKWEGTFCTTLFNLSNFAADQININGITSTQGCGSKPQTASTTGTPSTTGTANTTVVNPNDLLSGRPVSVISSDLQNNTPSSNTPSSNTPPSNTPPSSSGESPPAQQEKDFKTKVTDFVKENKWSVIGVVSIIVIFIIIMLLSGDDDNKPSTKPSSS